MSTSLWQPAEAEPPPAFATDIAAIAGLPPRSELGATLDRSHPAMPSALAYVESKSIDWRRMQDILALSQQANRWANFGPVSLALERVLGHLLGLPAERAVIACASGTVALAALAGLHAAKRGRALRWVVSAYTFFNQRLGPFADALVVDCDDSGLIDLEAVAALPEESWDGLVLTNLFGAITQPQRYVAFCHARGKALIVDSAGALLGPNRSTADAPEEALSFHHTKPWGVGEGGTVIVARDDAATIRAILNFGIGGPAMPRSLCGNGKISDIACAAILERLERLPDWALGYQAQRRRIEGLCAEIGLPLLMQAPDSAVSSAVPILAARPVTAAELSSAAAPMRKYYPPLDPACRNAMRIFGHIVNVACHPGIAMLPDATITAALRRFAPGVA